MQNTLSYLLCSSLIPELRADIAACSSCDIKRILVPVMAVRAFPYKLSAILNYLYLSVKAALLAVIALGVKLGIHDVVIYELKNRYDCIYIVLKIRNFHIAYSAAG